MAPRSTEWEEQDVPNEAEAGRSEVQGKDDAALLRTMGYKPVSIVALFFFFFFFFFGGRQRLTGGYRSSTGHTLC